MNGWREGELDDSLLIIVEEETNMLFKFVILILFTHMYKLFTTLLME
jgi:hypothetical protein